MDLQLADENLEGQASPAPLRQVCKPFFALSAGQN
jgi:hypothetical protein